GLILSQWITAFAVSRAPLLPRIEDVATDTRVLLFAIGVCALTTILFGMLPAWQSSRADPLAAMSAGSRGNTLHSRGIRRVLIAGEVALCVVLVIGSGLLVRSFQQVVTVPRGFDGHDVMIAELQLSASAYQSVAKQNALFGRLRGELMSIPGVLNVSAN